MRAGLHRPISDEDREDVAGETGASTKSTHTPPVGPDLGRLGFGDRDGDTPRGLEMPLAAGDVPTISPRMTAVFGGLFGLATVASIVALLIQIFPVTDQRSVAAQATTEAQQVQAPETAPAKPKKRERQLLSSPWRVDELKDTHLVVRGKMERRAFITALSEAGVPKAEVYRVLKAMEGVRKFDRTGKYDTFIVAMARGTKKVNAFEYVVDKTEIYQARTGDDGLLKGDRLDMKVRHDEVAASIYIGKDFVKSYERAGLEPGLSEVVNDAFLGRISTESFEEGGVLKLVVVETTALGAFVGYERIRAVEYRPPDPAKQPVRAYWFEGERSKGYVDDRGRRPTNKGWRTPTPGAPITSHFNPTRMHPVLKRVMPHNGTDFGAPSGTPVYAAFRGTVAAVGMHGASGNLVLIDHPGSIQTGYAHLSRFASGIKVGDKVGVRQLIGYVGSTGRSTGPHLHFSAKRDGKFFDALELKLDALEVLPVEERALFLQQKSQLDGVLEAMPLPDPPEPEPAPADDPPSESASAREEESAESEGDPESDPESDPERDPERDEGAARPAAKSADEDLGGDLLGDDLSGDIE